MTGNLAEREQPDRYERARPARFSIANRFKQTHCRERLSQERGIDRHRRHRCTGHNDYVHMRVLLPSIMGKCGTGHLASQFVISNECL